VYTEELLLDMLAHHFLSFFDLLIPPAFSTLFILNIYL
jgi:hypothetical protein